jgi:hypothetical protein
VEAFAPVTSVQLVLSVDDCHWMIPVEPVKERVVFSPAQSAKLLAEAVPATGKGSTVNTVTLLVTVQDPELATK